MTFDKYSAKDMILSLGPKRSVEKNTSNKRCFHGDKSFWPIFPHIIECDKPQETICECRQAKLTITAELTRASLQVLRGF